MPISPDDAALSDAQRARERDAREIAGPEPAAPGAALAPAPADPLAVPGVSPARVAATRAALGASRAANTRRAYATAWRAWEAWASAHGLVALPADPVALAHYLTERADAGIRPGSLACAVTGINFAHEEAGLQTPGSTPGIRRVLQGIRRQHGNARRKARPVLIAELRAVLEAMAPSLDVAAAAGRGEPAALATQRRAVRDRALLVVGFAGAFRCSELVALDAVDVAAEGAGLRVAVRRSKTDQEGEGATVALARGAAELTCPARALAAWLDALTAAGAGTDGALFRRVMSNGTIGARLSDDSIAEVIRARYAAAGLDPAGFSGHSLRRGLATEAARGGAAGPGARKTVDRIMRHGRWKSPATVMGYIAEAEAFDESNASSGIGL